MAVEEKQRYLSKIHLKWPIVWYEVPNDGGLHAGNDIKEKVKTVAGQKDVMYKNIQLQCMRSQTIGDVDNDKEKLKEDAYQKGIATSLGPTVAISVFFINFLKQIVFTASVFTLNVNFLPS